MTNVKHKDAIGMTPSRLTQTPYPLSRRQVLGCLATPLVSISNATADTSIPQVAIVIGNAGYSGAPLVNTIADARAMAQVLRSLQFDVVELHDASRSVMLAAVEEAGKKLQGRRGIGLMYFAGHGIQVGFRNYLIPIGSDPSSLSQVANTSFDVQVVADTFRNAGNRLSIVILDACRENPFTSMGVDRGLSPIEAAPGMLLAYATSPGNVALDDGPIAGHGLYSGYLVQALRESAGSVEDIFKRVRWNVRRASEGRQIPWESTSLEERYSFSNGFSLSPTLAEDARAQVFEKEKANWDRVRDSANAEDVYTFLLKYPNGYLAEIAKIRLEQLQRSRLLASDRERLRSVRFRVGDREIWERVDLLNPGTSLTSRTVTRADSTGVYFDNERHPSKNLTGDIVQIGQDKFDPPIVQYPFDLVPGMKWRSAFNTIRNGERLSTSYWDFAAQSQVSVALLPAQFDAIAVTGQGEGRGRNANTNFEMSYWVDSRTLTPLRHEVKIVSEGTTTQWYRNELVALKRQVGS